MVVAEALTSNVDRTRRCHTPIAFGSSRTRRAELLVREAVDPHRRLDVLVKNVGGVRLRLNGFLEITDADFEGSLQPNFLRRSPCDARRGMSGQRN